MPVIGLTGNLGTGKSTVARMFAGFGAKVVDADRITHRLMRPGAPCFRLVVKMFGRGILSSGRINRKKVAARVFNDAAKRRRLERIVHPEVRKAVIKEIRRYANRRHKGVLILDVPLLFEAKLDKFADISIVVKADKKKQIARAVRLLGITKAEAQKRIRAQMPLRQKIRLADMIIDNNGTRQQTQKQVRQIWERL